MYLYIILRIILVFWRGRPSTSTCQHYHCHWHFRLWVRPPQPINEKPTCGPTWHHWFPMAPTQTQFATSKTLNCLMLENRWLNKNERILPLRGVAPIGASGFSSRPVAPTVGTFSLALPLSLHQITLKYNYCRGWKIWKNTWCPKENDPNIKNEFLASQKCSVVVWSSESWLRNADDALRCAHCTKMSLFGGTYSKHQETCSLYIH